MSYQPEIDLRGKSVALVGNGPVIEAAAYIDACDVVIRCNDFKTDPEHRGTKTSIHALNPTATHFYDPTRQIPILLVARKDRLRRIPDLYKDALKLDPTYLELVALKMRARPTIGFMLMYWLVQISGASLIRLAGFSWSNDGMSKVHDLREEYRLFEADIKGKVVVL